MLLIVKVGTSTLTSGTPHISPPLLVELARQVTQLQTDGHQIILVSSGAIAAGREKLGFPKLPRGLSSKQMLAAIGQPRLMAIYEQVFGLYGRTVAQVLLTRADLADRRRYLNARGTLHALLAHRAVPIINENDTVATEEIRVGDNDNLSALVANVVQADLLILLTDQRGLFTGDPRSDPSARLVDQVDEAEIPPALWESAGDRGTGLGTGGMVTKLQAADLARRSGTTVIIAHGTEPHVLIRLVQGERIGTRFTPIASALESRKRYILSGRLAPGQITINDGATTALRREPPARGRYADRRRLRPRRHRARDRRNRPRTGARYHLVFQHRSNSLARPALRGDRVPAWVRLRRLSYSSQRPGAFMKGLALPRV
jgi:glutamate 5-kinase